MTRCAAILFALTCLVPACSGSQGSGTDEPEGCYESCLDTCGSETRGPDAPSCADECNSVCEGRRIPGGGGPEDEGGQAGGTDAGSTGAIFTVTDP